MQDTRTPPLLDAIYEQITRGAAGYSDLVGCSDLSDEHNKYQELTDYSLGYSHLAAQLSAYELDLQNAPMPRENQELEVSVQRTHTESVNSQNLHRRLELSCTREQKLDADLLASEQERERLIELVSTSRRNQQGWKEIATIYKEFYGDAEMTASNLRVDLTAASDRVRNVQEQLDHQITLASDKDSMIQSITKESRLAQTRLRLERDRRVRETKELLHEKVMIRSEMRRFAQEALDAQEQLDALRDTLSQLRSDGQTPLDRDHLRRYQPPTTWPHDTGQPPLPPEWNLDTGTPPVSSAIEPDSSHQSTKWSTRSPIQDPINSPTHLAVRPLEIPGACDQESEVAKKQRAAPAELIERKRQVEPESDEDVKPNERDETRLQEELIATKEQLRLAEEDVRNLRRELGRSRELLREAETHVRALEHELDICQATVREAQEAQYASEVKFTEATQLLRVHQTESESSTARAEESELKCSRVTFLCTALQERVAELEAEVKKLKSARKYRAHSNSRSRRPTGTRTGMLVPDLRCLVCLYIRALSDLKAVAHDPGILEFDSIFMTVPPSMSRLLDLPLPPSSPSNDSSTLFKPPGKFHNTNCLCRFRFALSYKSRYACAHFTPVSHAHIFKRLSDPEASTHDTDAHTFDSIFLTTPPSLPCLPDFSLPPSSSQSSCSSPLSFSHQMRPAISSCTDSNSFSSEDMGTHTLDLHGFAC